MAVRGVDQFLDPKFPGGGDEEGMFAQRLQATPWWGWWSWPYWWFQFNGFGECQWTVKLEPGKEQVLEARWHYFWR